MPGTRTPREPRDAKAPTRAPRTEARLDLAGLASLQRSAGNRAVVGSSVTTPPETSPAGG